MNQKVQVYITAAASKQKVTKDIVLGINVGLLVMFLILITIVYRKSGSWTPICLFLVFATCFVALSNWILMEIQKEQEKLKKGEGFLSSLLSKKSD